jgi:hypothetical protein
MSVPTGVAAISLGFGLIGGALMSMMAASPVPVLLIPGGMMVLAGLLMLQEAD